MAKTSKRLFLGFINLMFLNFASAATEGMPSMPKLQPKKIMTVQGNEDFESQKGFGDQAPMVKMMNLMMVEGSGMEGMTMDMSNDKSMNMSIAEGGHNEPKQSNKKISKSEKVPDDSSYDFVVKNLSGPAKIGVNKIEVSITDLKTKKPVKGLMLKSQVFMTSMNMGTEEPEVKESSPGKYQVNAPFAMKGPWAVKLILPDNKEKLLNFEVNTKK